MIRIGNRSRSAYNKATSDLDRALIDPSRRAHHVTTVAANMVNQTTGQASSSNDNMQVEGVKKMFKNLAFVSALVLVVGGCVMDENHESATSSAELSISDLSLEILSLNPPLIRIPSSALAPVIQEKLSEVDLHESDDTTELRAYDLKVDLHEGFIELNAMVDAQKRMCVQRPWPWHPGLWCTPWLSATGQIALQFSVSVTNWKVTAEHQRTTIRSSNDIVNVAVQLFGGLIESEIKRRIDVEVQKINGRDLRDEIMKYVPLSLPSNAILNVRVKSDGLYLELSEP